MARYARTLAAGLLCLWFGLVMPAHQRGRLTLADPGAPGPHACCPPAPRDDASCHVPPEGGRDAPAQPSPRDVANCAVCFLVAKLDHAVAPALTAPELALLERLSPPVAESLRGVEFVATPLARGPPAPPARLA